MSLHTEIASIWSDDMGQVEHTTFTPEVRHDGALILKVHRMYEAPALTTMKLMALTELFGTLKIDVDGYGHSGCESCDHGIDYGHELEIVGATKRVDEFKAWAKEKR